MQPFGIELLLDLKGGDLSALSQQKLTVYLVQLRERIGMVRHGTRVREDHSGTVPEMVTLPVPAGERRAACDTPETGRLLATGVSDTLPSGRGRRWRRSCVSSGLPSPLPRKGLHMPPELLPVVLIVVLVVMTAIALITYLVVKVSRHQARQGPPEKETRTFTGTVRARAGESAYEATYFPGTTGKHAKPPHLRVTLPCPLPGEFSVVHEGGFDRFCKSIGLASEVQTGDVGFDTACYIQTDHPAFCRGYFADGQHRQAVLHLLRRGFGRVDHDGTTLSALWEPYTLGPERGEADAREAAETLLPLVRAYEPEATADLAPRRLSRHSLRRVGSVGLTAGLALGFLVFFSTQSNHFPLHPWGLAAWSLLGSIPALLIYLWLSAWLVRGHSTSHHQFFALLGAGVATIPLLGVLGAYQFNTRWDTSPAEERIVAVVNKGTHTHKRRTTYHADVASWDHSPPIRLRLSGGEHAGIVPGQSRARLVCRGGRLGFPWIERYEFLPPSPSRP